jgi:hypothetical protein
VNNERRQNLYSKAVNTANGLDQGGSKRAPGGPGGKRSDASKANHRARQALRKHQAAQHPGEKNEFGQRRPDKSQVASCDTCSKLQATVDATN